jgi:hypothetical protein
VLAVVCLVAAIGCGGGGGGDTIDASLHDAVIVDGPDGSQCAAIDDIAVCRLTTGCVADFCSDCTCGQTFNGCRALAAEPDDCPPLLCPEPTCCGDGADCDSARSCYHPGESPGCGAPNDDPGDCTVDTECNQGAGEICEPIPCSSLGAFHCVAGCTGPGDCQQGTECNPEHRCTSQPCDDTSPCPTDFHCDESFCARDACVLDTDCAGFCVEGLCYDGRGTCAAPPP